MSFLKEFFTFLMLRKKYWLFPAIIILTLFSFLIILSQGSTVAPFIYAIFQQLNIKMFKKKFLKKIDDIYIFDYKDEVAEKVKSFYKYYKENSLENSFSLMQILSSLKFIRLFKSF